MNDVTRLAKHIRDRDNPTAYTPMFGTVISLPDLKIRLGSRVMLTAESDIKFMFNIYATTTKDEITEYVYLGKEILLLPYGSDNKFVAVGVIM